MNKPASHRLGSALDRGGFRTAVTLDNQGFILTITAKAESAGLMGAWKRYSWLKAHKAQFDIEFGKRLWVDQLLTVQVHRQWPEHAPSKGIRSSADEALALLARLEKAIALSPSASSTRTQPQAATPVPIQVQLPTRHPTPTKDPPF